MKKINLQKIKDIPHAIKVKGRCVVRFCWDFLKKILLILKKIILTLCWGHRVLTTLLIIVTLLFTFDFYCSRHGIPSSIRRKIVQHLNQEYQLDLKIDRIKLGFWQGFSIENVEVRWPHSDNVAIHIKQVSCNSLRLLLDPHSQRKMTFTIEKGSFFLPGEQTPILAQINTEATYNRKHSFISIGYFSSLVDQIPFQASGEIILPTQIQEVLSSSNLPSIQAPSEPEPLPEEKVSYDLAKLEQFLKKHKKKLTQFRNELNQCIVFRNQGNVSTKFHYDFSKKNLRLEGDFLFPNITLPHVALQRARGHFSLDHLILEFTSLELLLNGRDSFNLRSGIDFKNKVGYLTGNGYIAFFHLVNLLCKEKALKSLMIREPLQLEDFHLDFRFPTSKKFKIQDILTGGDATISIPSLTYQQLTAENLKLKCSLTKESFLVKQLQFSLSKQEHLDLSGEYNLKNKNITCQGRGVVTLNSIMDLQKTPLLPEVFSKINTQTPIHFSGNFQANENLEWKVKAKIDTSLETSSLPTSSFSAQLQGNQNLLELTEIHVTAPQNKQISQLTGSLSYYPSTQQINGDLDFYGNGNLILDLFPQQTRKAQIGATSLRLHLESSPLLSPEEWQGHLVGKASHLSFGDYSSPKISVDLKFSKGNIVVDKMVFDLSAPRQKNKNLFILNGHFSYSLSTAHPTLSGKWLGAFQNVEEKQILPVGLFLEGSLEVNTENLTITTDAQLSLDKIYQRIFYASKIPKNDIGSRIVLHKAPAHVVGTFTLPLGNPQDWEFKAKIGLSDTTYKNWKIKEGSCDFQVNQEQMHFSNINGISDLNEPLRNVDIFYHFIPGVLKIHGEGEIDPRFAEAFIDHENTQLFYRSIWEHLKFSPNYLPKLVLNELKLTYDYETNQSVFTMQATFEVNNLTYRNTSIAYAKGEINIDLDNENQFKNLLIKLDEESLLTGDITISNDPQPICSLDLKSTNINPKKVLATIDPTWESFLGKLEFNGKHHHLCHGSISIEPFPKIRLQGESHAEQITWDKILANKVQATWRFNDSNEVFWDAQADLWHGAITTTGIFNFNTNLGQTSIRANHISIAESFRTFSTSPDALNLSPKNIEERGFFSGDFSVNILKNWVNIPWQFTGTGRCRLTAPNLWNTPLFTSLAKAIDKNSLLGVISNLDADLNFKGQQLDMSFKTNGTLVALAGTGFYHLKNNQLVLRISGKALKDWRLFAWLLRPLSWLFEVELHGTPQKYKWYFIRGIKGWFSSNPADTPPDTYQDYWQ